MLSEPLRPDPEPGVLQRLREHESEIVVPALAWHELRFGCARLPKGRRRAASERYLDDVISVCFEFLAYDRVAAGWHAEERARLNSEGREPAFVDGQIAAIARVNGLVLVTFNRRDFEIFHDLQIEDWRGGT